MVEISGFVGSNFWVCKSVFGFDFWVQFWLVYVDFWVLNFGGCMLIFGFWLVYGYKESTRKTKKRKENKD